MLINGDAAAVPLGDATVHCVVTSPPYWSLRKYAGEQERDWPAVQYSPMPGLPELTVDPMRYALGLESTPEAYIGHMVLVFQEVWRVLREDGVCWIVIGDSYMEGDLIMIPHRLALALQGDGWVVRNDVVWNKLNPMPESVRGWAWSRCKVKIADLNYQRGGSRTNKDRNDAGVACNLPYAQYTNCPGCDKCEANDGYVLRRGSWRHTRSHEVVLMLVKGMGYFANQEAVREATTGNAHSRGNGLHQKSHQPGMGVKQNESFSAAVNEVVSARNPRSVLTLSGESYSGTHYAVFPTKLIAPLIRATCPAKCCPVCGAGWAPVVERNIKGYRHISPKDDNPNRGDGPGTSSRLHNQYFDEQRNVLGYRPSCVHNELWAKHAGKPVPEPVPGIVLDPFVGSGTTLQVANELGLRSIGLDLSHSYLDNQAKVRSGIGAPSNALDGLPMFADAGGETAL